MLKKLLILCLGSVLCITIGNVNAQTQKRWEQLSTEEQALLEAALTVRHAAYVPYSHYQVGAAVQTREGKIIPGVNVENASYGLTLCAERNAMFSAVSAGYQQFTKIAIVTKDGGTPCGACRQVMSEFNPKMEVFFTDENKSNIIATTVEELLPASFVLKERG